SLGASERKFYTRLFAVTAADDKAGHRSPALKLVQYKRLNPQEQLVLRRDLFPSDNEHWLVVECPNLRGAVHSLERIEVNRHFRVIKVSAENHFGSLCQDGAGQGDVLNRPRRKRLPGAAKRTRLALALEKLKRRLLARLADQLKSCFVPAFQETLDDLTANP